MRYLVTTLAVLAMLLTMEATAPGQTQPSPSSQAQGDKREPEPARESSNEDEGAVGPGKKLPKSIINLTRAPIQFTKDAVARQDKNNNVLSLGRWAQSQTQPSAPAQSQPPQTAPPQVGEAADLAKQLSNPVASLISLPFQMNWDTGVGPDEDTRHLSTFSRSCRSS